MKIRNRDDEKFEFEGVTIEPYGTIEVSPEVGQRLLALYWHSKLELVEEPKTETAPTGTTETAVPPTAENQCPVCGKVFKNAKGLFIHRVNSKKCKK